MGCAPTHQTPPTTTTDQPPTNNNNTLIFTTDERLKLKEVWVIVKQNGMKKLADEIITRALERNATLTSYWQTLPLGQENHLFTFNESDANASKDLIWKQTYKQHGYQILEKIDQIIMIMVTRIATDDSDDALLHEQFRRIAESHAQYKIKEDHIDVLTESFGECLKNTMHQNGREWTSKHASTWQKLLGLMTNRFPSPTRKK